MVAEVDEGEVLAVLAAAVHPAAHGDGAARVVGSETSAEVGPHGRAVAPGHQTSPTANWQPNTPEPAPAAANPPTGTNPAANWQPNTPEPAPAVANCVAVSIMALHPRASR